MTLEQLKTEIRNAYDGHDRERLEWALARLPQPLAQPETKPPAGETVGPKGETP